MASVICPSCQRPTILSADEYNDTFQCGNCSAMLRVRIKGGKVANVRTHNIFLDIPDGLSKELEKIVYESIACYEVEAFAASVVMAGLFIEGLMKESGVPGDRLVDMIKNAKDMSVISDLGFHVATASRLLRNTGAHYSEDLTKISDSDARLTLEMARKLAVDIIESKVLSSS